MSYSTERFAIETYLAANWSATPLGMDYHTFTPVANSVCMMIQNGAKVQGSVGRISNRVEYVGLVQILIYTEPGKGSTAWRGYADTLDALFTNARLNALGAAITAVDEEFIRFSPRDQHPSIAGSQVNAGLMSTTFNAPFSRYNWE